MLLMGFGWNGKTNVEHRGAIVDQKKKQNKSKKRSRQAREQGKDGFFEVVYMLNKEKESLRNFDD